MLKLKKRKMSVKDFGKIEAHAFNPRGWDASPRESLVRSIDNEGWHPVSEDRLPVVMIDDGAMVAIRGWNRIKAIKKIIDDKPERAAELFSGDLEFYVLTGTPTDADILGLVSDDDSAQVAWTRPERIDVYMHWRRLGETQIVSARRAGYKGKNSMLDAVEKLDADTIAAVIRDGHSKTPAITDKEIINLGQVAKDAQEKNPVSFAKGERGEEYDKLAADIKARAGTGQVAVTAKALSGKDALACVAMLAEHKYDGPFTKQQMIDLLTCVSGHDPATNAATASNPTKAYLGNLLGVLTADKIDQPKRSKRSKVKA